MAAHSCPVRMGAPRPGSSRRARWRNGAVRARPDLRGRRRAGPTGEVARPPRVPHLRRGADRQRPPAQGALPRLVDRQAQRRRRRGHGRGRRRGDRRSSPRPPARRRPVRGPEDRSGRGRARGADPRGDDPAQRATELSTEHAALLAADARAAAFWAEATATYRKLCTHWVNSAKQAATRERRIAQLVDDSAHGRLIKSQRYGDPPRWHERAAAAAAAADPGV